MKKPCANIPDKTDKRRRAFIPVLIAIGLGTYTLIAKDLANSALTTGGNNGWSGGYFLVFFAYPFVAILVFVGGQLWIGAFIFSAISAYQKDPLPIMLWLVSAASSYLLCGWIWPVEKPVVETQNEPHQHSHIYGVNYWPDRTQKYILTSGLTENEEHITGAADALSSRDGPACCLTIPPEWHPGVKLKLDWWDADHDQTYGKIHTVDLELPQYGLSGDIYIVFYQHHEAEIFVSTVAPGEAGWPGRIKQSPWDMCVAEQGRKACMLGMPFAEQKLADFRGYCTTSDMSACESLLRECVQYYEDVDFCKNLVWESRKK